MFTIIRRTLSYVRGVRIPQAENQFSFESIHSKIIEEFKQKISNLPVKRDIDKFKNVIDRGDRQAIREVVNDVSSRIKSMNQQELAVLLTSIRHEESTEYRPILKLIDLELKWLLKSNVGTRLMDLDLWFYLAGVFFQCSMKSGFATALVNYLTKEKIALTNNQLMHLLFLTVVLRRDHGILQLYEAQVEETLDHCSFENIATICMAYFKTKKVIKNESILKKIIRRTIDYLPNIDHSKPGLCAIVKCIRYSCDNKHRSSVIELSNGLTKFMTSEYVSKYSINTIHIIKMMEAYRIYDPKTLDVVMDSLMANIDSFRVKDIQYLLTSLSNFAYRDLHLDANHKVQLDRLCDDITSNSRIDQYKQAFHLIPLLRAFTIFGFYNDKIIEFTNRVITDEMKLSLVRSPIEFDKSSLLIHTATHLENPSKVLSLDKDFLDNISNSIDRFGNVGSVKRDSSLDHLSFILTEGYEYRYYSNSKSMRLLASNLASLPEFKVGYNFNFQYTLPHQNYADLVISKKFKPPGQFDPETLHPKQVPADQKHCVMVGLSKSDLVDGEDRISGMKRLTGRLLEKLGYRVLYVDFHESNMADLAQRINQALDA